MVINHVHFYVIHGLRTIFVGIDLKMTPINISDTKIALEVAEITNARTTTDAFRLSPTSIRNWPQ